MSQDLIRKLDKLAYETVRDWFSRPDREMGDLIHDVFATLETAVEDAVEEEREACASLVETRTVECVSTAPSTSSCSSCVKNARNDAAAAIRARGALT